MPLSRSLEFFYFDAGGGHRSSAIALQQATEARFPGWHIELVNLQEILRPIDPVHRLTEVYHVQDFYNGLLKRGWTYGSASMLRLLQAGVKISARPIERLLEEHWQWGRPDLVVSLIPNFNRAMFRALRRVHADTPYVTVMTDLADCPPHFWQEKQDQFMVCAGDFAIKQAERMGYAPERLFQSSGMILKPHFYESAALSDEARRQARLALGLDADLPTALIMFGGYGSDAAAAIHDRILAAQLPVQSIVLCGHNEKLRQALAGRPRCHAVGFTEDVPHYMRLADFFIGKPGSTSVSEALHMGLPVILERNARTMPQEYYMSVWVEEQELGLIISSFSKVAIGVRALLEDGRLERLRRNAQKLDNRAVFEIPLMFEQIMQGAEAALPAERRQT